MNTDLIDRRSVANLADKRKRDSSPELEDSLKLYLRSVASVPRLSPSEERALFRRKEAGDQRAKRHLIEANLRLVVWVARQYARNGVPLLDLIQEGNLALATAVERYDYRRGCKLSTYACWWIKLAIQRAIGPHGRLITVPVHVWQQIRAIQSTQQVLLQRLNREPLLRELAAELGVDWRRVAALLDFARHPVSLQALEDGEGIPTDLLEDVSLPRPEATASEHLCAKEVETALDALDDRLRLIIELRFGLHGESPHSLKEVGRELGVTRERVRQLEARALELLQEHAPELRDYLNVA